MNRCTRDVLPLALGLALGYLAGLRGLGRRRAPVLTVVHDVELDAAVGRHPSSLLR